MKGATIPQNAVVKIIIIIGSDKFCMTNYTTWNLPGIVGLHRGKKLVSLMFIVLGYSKETPEMNFHEVLMKFPGH